MITLKELEVTGFGPYADPAVLEFPPQGVTVVYADNGRGKTNLMKALRYALLGSPLAGTGEETRRSWVLASCNRDLASAGQFGFHVRLQVEDEGQPWEIARAAVSRSHERPISDGDFDLETQLRRPGYVAGPDERDRILEAMMPREISRFFLFDGELLNQYADLLDDASEVGRRISDSIEQILGVPVLKNAREHLSAVTDRLSAEVATEASKDSKTEQVGRALKGAIEVRQQHEAELARAHDTLAELIGERDRVEEELGRQEVFALALERLERARKDRARARETQATKLTALRTAMSGAWRSLLSESVIQVRADSHQALEAAVERLRWQLRAHAIESHHCAVCDQELDDQLAEHLRSTLPAGEGSGAEGTAMNAAIARAADLDRFDTTDITREVAVIWADYSQARMEEVAANSRITDEEDILQGHDEGSIRSLGVKYQDTIKKISSIQLAMDEHQSKIAEQVQAVDRLSSRLKILGASELSDLQRRYDLATAARDVFRRAVDRYKIALRGRVESTATDLFLRMTTEPEDYVRLRINDHYGLAIVHRDGQEEVGRSAGQEQVVALALIGALQANAPLRGPIVMDTPFGRLDPDHTKKVVRALPSMAHQIVLFVQEGEIDRATVREQLGAHLINEYELKRDSARRTRVVRVR